VKSVGADRRRISLTAAAPAPANDAKPIAVLRIRMRRRYSQSVQMK